MAAHLKFEYVVEALPRAYIFIVVQDRLNGLSFASDINVFSKSYWVVFPASPQFAFSNQVNKLVLVTTHSVNQSPVLV
jgi:hypothetical protein